MGAGATRAASEKAPLNYDLVEKALGDFSATDEARRLSTFLQAVYQRENPPANNQIWNLLDYLIQRGGTGSEIYSLEKVVELREDLMKLLIRLFRERLGNAEHRLFTRFVEAGPPGTTVISTNYDILLDNGFLENQHCNYGAKIRRPVKPGGAKSGGMDRAFPDAMWDFINRGDFLLKLHGSLNWLYCRRCDEVDVVLRNKPAETAFTSLYCSNDNCTGRYEPLLITPTMFKSYENRFIKEVWDLAGKALASADELIFIGFALKEEDYHIRSLLMSALLCRGKPYDKVTVIEKNQEEPVKSGGRLGEIETRYRELYGDAVVFRADGFENFVERLEQPVPS